MTLSTAHQPATDTEPPPERELPASMTAWLTLAVIGLGGVIGLALFFAAGYTDVFFAWHVQHPATAATLGGGYLASVVLLVLSMSELRWVDARLALLVTLVQVTGVLGATLLSDGVLAGSDDGLFPGIGSAIPPLGGVIPGFDDGAIPGLVALGWLGFHLVAPLIVLLALAYGLFLARGRPGQRRKSLPLWVFLPLALPFGLILIAGAAIFADPRSYGSWIPWDTSVYDARMIAVWLFVIGLAGLGAILEHDVSRLRGAILAGPFIGLLMLVNALRYLLDLPLLSAPVLGYYAIAAVLLLVGGAGLFLQFALPDPERWAAKIRRRKARRGGREVTPMADNGFFGPDSVTWRVWAYPTSLTIGFQRAVVIEELDPFLLASVDATHKIRTQPRIRYDHTIKYFATVAFADTKTAVKASEVLMRIHERVVGVEPHSGERYDANDPDTQLWILLTGWESVLHAYETYGPGKLSEEDDRRYWAECAVAAELQTCDPAKVPASSAEMLDYYERVRPKLSATDTTVDTMDYLLNAKHVFPKLPWILKPGAWVVNYALRKAVIGIMPRWQRDMAKLRQSWMMTALAVPVMRISMGLATRFTFAEKLVLKMISPSTVPVVSHVLYNVPATSGQTLTPDEAFALHGVPTPAQLRAAALAKTQAEPPADAVAVPAAGAEPKGTLDAIPGVEEAIGLIRSATRLPGGVRRRRP